jgi:hypothetical protein
VFDIRKKVHKHGDQDEELVQQYIDGLMTEFAQSPEAQPILEQEGNVGWAGMMMEYYFGYLGGEFPSMSVRDSNEVLFQLFPRKVSVEPETAPIIIAELRAFWAFVHRQYGLKSAERILATLDAGAEVRLRKELADPSNFGMAKSFVMGGMNAGFDMTTQEGLEAFTNAYNASLLGGPLGGPPVDEFADEFDIEPPPSPLTHDEKKKKRAERKRQRQARKRNRK